MNKKELEEILKDERINPNAEITMVPFESMLVNYVGLIQVSDGSEVRLSDDMSILIDIAHDSGEEIIFIKDKENNEVNFEEYQKRNSWK